MSFERFFENGQRGRDADTFWERVPEGGGSDGEGPVTPSPVLVSAGGGGGGGSRLVGIS